MINNVERTLTGTKNGRKKWLYLKYHCCHVYNSSHEFYNHQLNPDNEQICSDIQPVRQWNR